MRPLEGIKIVELAEYVALPAAPRILSDWGASVIKVEKPSGDPQRRQGVTFGMVDFTQKDYNQALDMLSGGNKEYISLNLKSEEGMAILHELLADADVLATSWRPKALRKLGLDYETLKEKYPRLVYAQIVGYGDKGEYVEAPGYDAVCYSARGGIMRSLPQRGDAPACVPQAFGDLQAGVAMAGGICGALLGRERTGKGDRVCVSLYHTALFMMTHGIVAANPPYTSAFPASRREIANPLNNSYPTKDDQWLLICLPVYDVSFNKVAKLIGREDLVDHPLWSSLDKVREAGKITEIIDIISEGFRTRTRAEWLDLFKQEDVPGGPCFTVNDIMNDELAWQNNYLRKTQYPDGFEGVLVDTPVRFNSMDLPELVHSKKTGADTFDVLKRFGYSQEQLEDMKERKVIFTEIQTDF